MFNRVQSKSKTKHDNVSNLRPAKSPPAGRERLKHFDCEVAKAQTFISELEERINRCESIITDADAAHKALQSQIESDNGKSLADYSAGNVPADSAIAKLVMVEHNSARAATAAKASLPTARDQLENAKLQLVALIDQRATELHRVLLSISDVEAQQYQAAFDKLCFMFDRLSGVASVIEANVGDIKLTTDPVKAPRFQFPSSGHPDADIFLRHRPSSLTVSEAASQYTAIRERLEKDALADIADLF